MKAIPPIIAHALLLLALSCSDDPAQPNSGTIVIDSDTASDVGGSDGASLDPADTAVSVADSGRVDGGDDSGVALPSLLPDWCQGQPDDFSFFVTSMDAIWALSGSTPGDLDGGFGGDFGGLAGADQICQDIGEATGNGDKTWRAFLSATDDGTGNAVHAIERIGQGPWYDANGRMMASGIDGLLAGDRPDGDAQSVNDLPDECGVPISALGDAHDTVTGSNPEGRLASTDAESTCLDWTSSDGSVGGSGNGGRGSVMIGHSFPRAGDPSRGQHWLSDHPVPGCGKGAVIVQSRPGEGDCIGCNGGFGGLYCFAL